MEEKACSSQLRGLEAWLDPFVEGLDVGARQSKEEGQRAAVQITRVSRFRRVDICVGIDLYNGQLCSVATPQGRLTQITQASGYFVFVPAIVPIAFGILSSSSPYARHQMFS